MTDPYTDGARPELTDVVTTEAPPAPEPLTLLLVDGRGRLNLSGVVAPGAHYFASTTPDGTVKLTPVRVATTSVKRSTIEDVPLPGV